MSKPKFKPDQRQADRVIRTEDQADDQPARARSRRSRCRSRGRARRTVSRWCARHPAVDGGDHADASRQQIEGDHRRSRQAARAATPAPYRPPTAECDEAVETPPIPCAARSRTDLAGVGPVGRMSRVSQGRLGSETSACSRREIARHVVDQGGELIDQGRRHHDHGQQDEGDDRPRTMIRIAATVRFMPARSSRSRERIEQIGERHAGDEGQQDLAEQPDRARTPR